MTIQEKFDLAEDYDTDKETLIELAKDENDDVRRFVAQNYNTPIEVLKILANDEKEDIQFLVAENLNSNDEIFEILLNQNNAFLQSVVLLNPQISDELLLKLSKDEDIRIKNFALERLEMKNSNSFLTSKACSLYVDLSDNI